MKPCLGCGKPISADMHTVGEGRCRKCYRESKINDPTSWLWCKLTPVGWFLGLVSMASCVLLILLNERLALFFGVNINHIPGKAAGLFLLPALIGAFAFFAFSSFVLKQLGLPAWKEPRQSANQYHKDEQTAQLTVDKRLAQLKELHIKGLISTPEYESRRQRVLDEI